MSREPLTDTDRARNRHRLRAVVNARDNLRAIRERAEGLGDDPTRSHLAADVLLLVGRIQELEALDESFECNRAELWRERANALEARAVKAEAERDTLREALKDRCVNFPRCDASGMTGLPGYPCWIHAALTQGAGDE